MNRGIAKEALERVARMYRTNRDAAMALGITMWSLTWMIPNPISSPRFASSAMFSGVRIGPRLGTLKPYSIFSASPND